METHEFARLLMSKDRKTWQDPGPLLKRFGVIKGMTVADLGCGPGYFTLPLASSVGHNGLVYAVDAAPIMLEYLQRYLGKSMGAKEVVKIIQADISRTRIPPRSVDMALFANVLHDLPDHKSFLKEVRRICKPDASVVDLDWKKIVMDGGPPLEIRLSEAETRKILTDNRLQVLKEMEAGPYHYAFVCKPRPVR